MTKLSVNLNKVALLRNSRTVGIPSVVRAAEAAVAAGCHGITVHPRPDERHIRREDVYELSKRLNVEFNIEGNPFPEFMGLIRDVRPDQCTLVPDSPGQSTSDHGWNLKKDGEELKPIVKELRDLGVRVSIFLDPDEKQIPLAKDIGTDRIELYTEPYARAFGTPERDTVLAQYVNTAQAAHDAGLGVNAGHDLNLDNLPAFLRAMPAVAEVSIGHALISDAIFMGLTNAVQAYLKICEEQLWVRA